MAQTQIVSIYRAKFWAAYWITMRPYLLFVSGAAGMVGLSFCGYASVIRMVAALIPLFFSYGLGQALTDCFQTDTDSLSAPYRPLVRGIVSKKQVVAISLLGLLLSLLILMRLNSAMLIPGILAVIGLLTYTFLKRTWWGGPPWNSWIVALLPIMGLLSEPDRRIASLFDLHNPLTLPFLFALAAVFFGYANFVVMGYFKDISADRKTGYRTFPVVFGWTPTAIYSDITALAAALSVGGCLLTLGQTQIAALVVFAAALAINVHAQYKIHQTRSETESHGPIANVVRAFVLYCLTIVIACKPQWLAFLVVYYALFELTLRQRPEQAQI
jgi:geranylgeranylglycerol-phosphate geranylgeranyltransferase